MAQACFGSCCQESKAAVGIEDSPLLDSVLSDEVAYRTLATRIFIDWRSSRPSPGFQEVFFCSLLSVRLIPAVFHSNKLNFG